MFLYKLLFGVLEVGVEMSIYPGNIQVQLRTGPPPEVATA